MLLTVLERVLSEGVIAMMNPLEQLLAGLISLSGWLRGALSITLLLFALDTGLVAYVLNQLSSVVQS